MKEQTRQRLIYLISDFVTLNIGMAIFYVVRYYIILSNHAALPPLREWLLSERIVGGQILFPIVILGLFALSGCYNRSQLFYRSRLDEFINTLGTSLAGMFTVFLVVLINDPFDQRTVSYEIMLLLWACLFFPVYIARLFITSATTRRLRRSGKGWHTLIVGQAQTALKEARRLEKMQARTGLTIIGLVDPTLKDCPADAKIDGLPLFGASMDFAELKQKMNLHAVILTPHPSGLDSTMQLINRLYPLDLPMLIPPSLHQLITMRPRTDVVSTEPLIDITNANVPPRLANIKRLSDVLVSFFGLVVLSPVLAGIALAVKLDSKGPAIYRQERIGYHKKPFKILKFRSMYVGAEDTGPALSTENDPRITRVGRVLRKYRLDELLQLWNVLVGEMSLVGPRPEREYYVRQIIKEVPAYSLVHQVRPGITSWGMVRYGYASTVPEMIERLRYDLLYIENVSLGIDLKILYHTVHTVLAGKGK